MKTEKKNPITHQERKIQANLRLLHNNMDAQKTMKQHLDVFRERKRIPEPYSQPKCCSDRKATANHHKHKGTQEYNTANPSQENLLTTTFSQWRDTSKSVMQIR